jgi:outer membrane protein OmpA-like peptidoglycan-associated protein
MISALAASLVLGGCSVSQPNALQAARANLKRAQQDPHIESLAAVPLYQATESLLRAERAWDESGDEQEVKHLAYLTNQRIEIARKIAQQKMAEAELQQLAQERDRLLMAARTREAESARQRARALAAQAEAARRQAALSKQQAELRQQELAALKTESAMTKEQAEQARQDALAKAREAEAAQRQLEARARELAALEQESQARLREIEQAQRAAERALSENKRLQEQLSELQARQTERGLELTLSSVMFDLDSAQLKPGAERNLAILVDFLKTHADRAVLIEGHTDSLGTSSYNQTLSEQRAQAVKDLLVLNGIEPQRITARGFGEQYPVVSNQALAGRQQNRRVEIVISSPQTADAEKTAASSSAAATSAKR